MKAQSALVSYYHYSSFWILMVWLGRFTPVTGPSDSEFACVVLHSLESHVLRALFAASQSPFQNNTTWTPSETGCLVVPASFGFEVHVHLLSQNSTSHKWRNYPRKCFGHIKMFSSMKVCQLLSRVRLFANPWAIALQAPLSVEFSRQERWSGLPCPSPGDLPNPGIEPGLLHCRQILCHMSY